MKKGVSLEDELILGVNERMSFVYTLHPQKVPVEEIAKILQKDNRIDVIALKKEQTVTVTSGIHSGKLQFHPKGDFLDEYQPIVVYTGEFGDIKFEDERKCSPIW